MPKRYADKPFFAAMIHRWYIQKFIPDLQPREHDKTAKAYLRAQKNAPPAKSREAFDRFRLKIHKFCISIRAGSVIFCTAGQDWTFSGAERQTAFGGCTYTRRGMGRRSQSRPLSLQFLLCSQCWGRVSPERPAAQFLPGHPHNLPVRTAQNLAQSRTLVLMEQLGFDRCLRIPVKPHHKPGPEDHTGQGSVSVPLTAHPVATIVSRSVPSSSVCTRSG